MKNWAILFVRTGTEEKLTRVLAAKFDTGEFLPFVPLKMTARRNKGVITQATRILFPGYIFIQTETEANQIAGKLRSTLADIPYNGVIFALLHYGNNKNDVVMREKERVYWERLFDAGFCVNGSIGIIEGDTIRVTSGPLTGMESKIKKINRHKREAIVEMDIMGDVRTIKLMLEIVEKI